MMKWNASTVLANPDFPSILERYLNHVIDFDNERKELKDFSPQQQYEFTVMCHIQLTEIKKTYNIKRLAIEQEFKILINNGTDHLAAA